MKLQRTDKVILITLVFTILGLTCFFSYVNTRKKEREEKCLRQEWMIVYKTQVDHLDTVYITDRFIGLRENSVFIYPKTDPERNYPETIYYNVKVVKLLN